LTAALQGWLAARFSVKLMTRRNASGSASQLDVQPARDQFNLCV
jgi:hypothetical protein